MSHHRTQVDGLALTIHEPACAVTGRFVLLLHGIGGCADTFGGVAPRLAAAGWRAVAWDAPGYGSSADPGRQATGPDSPGVYVDRVAALLTALDTPRTHLVGVSWGGVIATHVACRRPDLVSSLTLMDSSRGAGTKPEKAAAMRSRVIELCEAGADSFASARAPRLLAENPDPDVAEAVRSQMARVRVPGYAGAAEMMAQSDTGELLAQLTCPTLVVVGAEDRVTGVEESRLLADRIPGARFEMIDRAGHAAVQERPARVAEVLLQFLSDVEALRMQGVLDE